MAKRKPVSEEIRKAKEKEIKIRQEEGINGNFHGVLTTMVENMMQDAEKFYDGRIQIAGHRLRMNLKNIRKACKPWAEGIQKRIVEIKKG